MNLAGIISRDVPLVAPTPRPQFDAELASFLRYTRLGSAFEDVEYLIAKHSKVVKNIPTYLGQEIEVENVHKELALPPFWKCKTDGSLREGGMEFYSEPLAPVHAMTAAVALWLFKKKLNRHKPEYGWRTSNHVHLNVQELSEDEFKKLLILGMLFEPMFFGIAGKDREQSIFCVPLTQSSSFESLQKYYAKKATLKGLGTHWPKYTAMNLCRLYTFPYHADPHMNVPPHCAVALGTVEFRHLGGTPDVEKMLGWMCLILQLFQAAVKMPMETIQERIHTISSNNNFYDFVEEVFPDTSIIDEIPDSRMTIAKVKQLFVPPPKLAPAKTNSALGVFLTKVAERAEKDKPPKKKKPIADVVGLDATPFTTTISF